MSSSVSPKRRSAPSGATTSRTQPIAASKRPGTPSNARSLSSRAKPGCHVLPSSNKPHALHAMQHDSVCRRLGRVRRAGPDGVAGEIGESHGDEAGALGWPGAGFRCQHEPAGVLAAAERAQLHVLLRETELVNRVVPVAGGDRAIRFQAGWLAEQLPVLEAAVCQVEYVDELP